MSSQEFDGLTPAERDWVIEQVLDRYLDHWAWQEIRAAPSERDAIDWCRRYLRGGGCYWPADGEWSAGHIVYGSFAKRGDVEAEIGGRCGRLTWREVVRYARAGARQMALL